jgi:hypothetical protein
MTEIFGKIVTITSATVANDGRERAIIELLGPSPALCPVFRYIEVVKDPYWNLDDRLVLKIELQTDCLLRESAQEEARQMSKELRDLERENARYRYPTEGKEDNSSG